MTQTYPSNLKACGCIGPQNGEPLCPCKMAHRRLDNFDFDLIMKFFAQKDSEKERDVPNTDGKPLGV